MALAESIGRVGSHVVSAVSIAFDYVGFFSRRFERGMRRTLLRDNGRHERSMVIDSPVREVLRGGWKI